MGEFVKGFTFAYAVVACWHNLDHSCIVVVARAQS